MVDEAQPTSRSELKIQRSMPFPLPECSARGNAKSRQLLARRFVQLHSAEVYGVVDSELQ